MAEQRTDDDQKRVEAVAQMLAPVPSAPPPVPASTQWLESDRKPIDPHDLY